MSTLELWDRYRRYLRILPDLGFTLDISRMRFQDDFLETLSAPLQEAFEAMQALERGAIANPDERRMVGHYWLRAPELAPLPDLQEAIRVTLARIRDFSSRVHCGLVRGERGQTFTHLLVIGIGGSALGPQLVADALGSSQDKLIPCFMDNTDPEGMDRILTNLEPHLSRTLAVVISKSGSTPETRNGMIEAAWAYARAGLTFARHAVAITGDGSELFRTATKEGWLDIFPMWDWVGGRTSVTSAVGLLPAALQGIDIVGLLHGARLMDVHTRQASLDQNPAALMAAMWYYSGDGRGKKDMVVLPYKDRLLLFSRYLQQLVMESLGKELDLKGNVVHQGLAVYGNKGSTDQHAYVQQLREGLNNFFATFVEVLSDRRGPSVELSPGVTSGDYLLGFFLGTRQALYDNGRESVTLTLPEVTPQTLGALIALYERTVGFYATLININAYHQPGVEAGKKAASAVLALQAKLLETLSQGAKGTASELAQAIGEPHQVETLYKLLEHLAANARVQRLAGPSFLEDTFQR